MQGRFYKQGVGEFFLFWVATQWEKSWQKEAHLSLSLTICLLILQDETLNISTSNVWTIKDRYHILPSRVKLVLNEGEVCSLTLLVFVTEVLLREKKQNVKFSSQIIPSDFTSDVQTPTIWRNSKRWSSLARDNQTIYKSRQYEQKSSLQI